MYTIPMLNDKRIFFHTHTERSPNKLNQQVFPSENLLKIQEIIFPLKLNRWNNTIVYVETAKKLRRIIEKVWESYFVLSKEISLIHVFCFTNVPKLYSWAIFLGFLYFLNSNISLCSQILFTFYNGIFFNFLLRV